MCCAPRLPLLPDRCSPAWAISTAYVFGVGSDLELAALASSPDMPAPWAPPGSHMCTAILFPMGVGLAWGQK